MPSLPPQAQDRDQVQQERRRRRWEIWKTIDNLKEKKEARRRQRTQQQHHDGGDNDEDRFSLLLDRVVAVLELWAANWAAGGSSNISNDNDNNGFYQSFLNKNNFQHEIEESLQALYFLDEWRRREATHRRWNRGSRNGDDDGVEDGDYKFVGVDACGGKGVFTMLLQYVATLYWNNDSLPGNNDGNDVPCPDGDDAPRPLRLDRVVLFDRASAGINWDHLSAPASPLPSSFGETPFSLVPIEVWVCDLHQTDVLVSRFLERFGGGDRMDVIPLAVTGIHLCKLLSPALIGLCNMLGPERCPYLCLVPCCLPRAVRRSKVNRMRCGTCSDDGQEQQQLQQINRDRITIRVHLYENSHARERRLQLLKQREASKRKMRSKGLCILCQSSEHFRRNCPRRFRETCDRAMPHQLELANLPCWRCGVVGHFQAECPSSRDSLLLSQLEPPHADIDVSQILQQTHPFRAYCNLLATTIELLDEDGANDATAEKRRGASVAVHETDLTLTGCNGEIASVTTTTIRPVASCHHQQQCGRSEHSKRKGDDNNWNRLRKGVYIVAHRYK